MREPRPSDHSRLLSGMAAASSIASALDNPCDLTAPGCSPFIHCGWSFSASSNFPISSSAAIEAAAPLKCPEMVFLSHHITARHQHSGLEIRFDTRGALEFTAIERIEAFSSAQAGPLAVAAALGGRWAAPPEVKEISNKQDWTFLTVYQGDLLKHNQTFTPTEESLPVEDVRSRALPIKAFAHAVLYEDELHDNGISTCSVKIRLMEDFFFILMQNFVRVDHVAVRLFECRIFHRFGSGKIHRQSTMREETFQSLIARGMPRNPKDYNDPNALARRLPCTRETKEILRLPETA